MRSRNRQPGGTLSWAIVAAVVLTGLFDHEEACGEQTPAEQQLGRLLNGLMTTGLRPSAVGVTRRGTPIPCLLDQEDFDYGTRKTRILLVGGMDGNPKSVAACLSMAKWFHGLPQDDTRRRRFTLSIVPCCLPDHWQASREGELANRVLPDFPPAGDSYQSGLPETQYVWRWIGMHAPDLVVDVRDGGTPSWQLPNLPVLPASLLRLPGIKRSLEDGDLVAALATHKVCQVGEILGVRCNVDKTGSQPLQELLTVLMKEKPLPKSAARVEILRRQRRTPMEIARELSRHYGHELKQVVYIPSVALMGRLRLGELDGDSRHRLDVIKIVAPYYSGQRPTMGSRVSGSALSGHLIFTHLARLTGDMRYIELAKAAADLGFEGTKLRSSMPAHSEMSDAVFMGCPILAEVGRLTGEERYFRMCLQHLQFMQRHCLRDDGLYRHSPLDEAAWGRGNGFPALGLALSLSAIPDQHPQREAILKAFRNHLDTLLLHQDPSGAWHQIIDRPESYRELTCTCMVTFAMLRGVSRGWLPADKYNPRIDKAWRAIQSRIGSAGNLVDVCTGTGKQAHRRAYYDRKAILGRDARGSAMALLVATEMADWQQRRK